MISFETSTTLQHMPLYVSSIYFMNLCKVKSDAEVKEIGRSCSHKAVTGGVL